MSLISVLTLLLPFAAGTFVVPAAASTSTKGRRFTSFDDCTPANVSTYNSLHNTSYRLDFLILSQCEDVCGIGYGGYSNLCVLDALTTWVVPLFILVGNMVYLKVGRVGYGNYLAIVSNLLGDPIVTIMNLLAKLSIGRDKIYTAKRICATVVRANGRQTPSSALTIATPDFERDLATILWALDDYEENNKDPTDPRIDFAATIEYSLCSGLLTHQNPVQAVQETAFKISDVRVNNARRVILAILAYLAAVSASLVKVKMSDDIEYHLPHTIALRELYYWLIPAIVLSSMAGGWPSQWTSLKLLREMGTNLGCKRIAELKPMEPWSGGDYLFRARGRGLSGDLIDFNLALMAVVIAFVYSFAMSWSTPTKGLGCRGLTEIGFLVVWIVNAMITLTLRSWASRRIKVESEFWVWKWAWIKNGALALVSFSMLLFPFLGWWNSCICWSGYWTPGNFQPTVDLHLKKKLIELTGNLYPGLIFGAFLSQCALTVFMWLVIRGQFKRSRIIVNPRTDKSRRVELGISAVESLWDLAVFRWLWRLRWKNLRRSNKGRTWYKSR